MYWSLKVSMAFNLSCGLFVIQYEKSDCFSFRDVILTTLSIFKDNDNLGMGQFVFIQFNNAADLIFLIHIYLLWIEYEHSDRGW